MQPVTETQSQRHRGRGSSAMVMNALESNSPVSAKTTMRATVVRKYGSGRYNTGLLQSIHHSPITLHAPRHHE